MTRSIHVRTAFVAITAAALLATGMTAGSAPASASTPTEVSGTLADATPYRFVVPERWNGTVFVELDFAASTSVSGYVEHLLASGAAYGGTTRTVTGWDIAGAIDNQIEALERFEAAVGPATRRIATGTSMGGFVAAGVAQRRPGSIDGVASFCGGLSGAVSQWNQKLDTVYTLSRLLDPDGALPVTGIPADVAGSVSAWRAVLSEAQGTPEGRARIALAAAIGQLPAWAESQPRPSPRDPDAHQAGWYGALAGGGLPYIGQAMSSRRSLETITGGNPSWNLGVDYRAQFAAASKQDRKVVERLYRAAGLSLEEDLGIVDAGERIAADEAAVRQLEQGIEFDGALSVPVLTMSNIGDQISTVAQQDEYGDLVKAAGNGGLLRQIYVESVGHCAFSDAEKVAAVDVLLGRLDSGRWRSTSAATLNRAAEVTGLGEGRFLRFTPDDFTRPYAPSVPPQV